MLLVLNIRNWYMVLPDKLGFLSLINYETYNGLKFYCRSKSSDINEVVAVVSGVEYPEKYIRLKKNAVVFDLGANIGSFSLYLDYINKGIKYRGYAFEPFKENFDLLKRNCKINNLKNFVLLQKAVTDIDGIVYMNIDCNPDGVSIINKKHGAVPADSVKLSSFCKKQKINKISLIKMDIEGSEYALINEDMQFLAHSVSRIILEYHNLDSRYNKEWIIKKLSSIFDFKTIYDAQGYGVIYGHNKKYEKYT